MLCQSLLAMVISCKVEIFRLEFETLATAVLRLYKLSGHIHDFDVRKLCQIVQVTALKMYLKFSIIVVA